MDENQKNTANILLIILIILIIAYGIFLYVSWRQNKWIFVPYKPPPLPDNMFYPLGGVVELTPEEREKRKKLYLEKK